jgi:hypothetical protein
MPQLAFRVGAFVAVALQGVDGVALLFDLRAQSG